MKRRVLLFAALVAFASPAAAQAVASPPAASWQQAQDRRGGRGGDAAGQRMSLGEIVRRLRASRQGQMLDARPSTMGGRDVYVIVWEYPGGRIGNIYVDQRTGSVVGED